MQDSAGFSDFGSVSASASGRILDEVEQLGIGMFWATDAAGTLTFLSAPALRDF